MPDDDPSSHNATSDDHNRASRKATIKTLNRYYREPALGQRRAGVTAALLSLFFYEALLFVVVCNSSSSTAGVGLILGQAGVPIVPLMAFLIGRRLFAWLQSPITAVLITAGATVIMLAISYKCCSAILRTLYEHDYMMIQKTNMTYTPSNAKNKC